MTRKQTETLGDGHISRGEAISAASSVGVGGVVRAGGEGRVIPSFPVPPPGEVLVSAVPPAAIQFIPDDEHLTFQGLQLHLTEQQPFQDLILESEANVHLLQLSLVCGIVGTDFWSRRLFCHLLGAPSEEKSQFIMITPPNTEHLLQARLLFNFRTGSHLAQAGLELLILLRLPL